MASQGPHRDDPRALTNYQIDRLKHLDLIRRDNGLGGIGLEVDALIERLIPKTASHNGASAGESHPLLLAQAQCLFDLGIGPEVGKRLGQGSWSLEAYLATLPAPCEQCIAEADATLRGSETDRFLYFLVETRAGLTLPCESGKIVYVGNDTTFVPYNDVPVKGPYWALFHNGLMNRGKLPSNARTDIVRNGQIPASAIDGVCARLHYPEVITERRDNPAGHAMDLAGSVHAALRDDSAYLSLWGGQVKLLWHWDDYGSPQYGAAFRRECKHLAR